MVDVCLRLGTALRRMEVVLEQSLKYRLNSTFNDLARLQIDRDTDLAQRNVGYRCFVKKPMRSSEVCVSCLVFCIGLGLGLTSEYAHNDTNTFSLFPSVYWSFQTTRSTLIPVESVLRSWLKVLKVARHVINGKQNEFAE